MLKWLQEFGTYIYLAATGLSKKQFSNRVDVPFVAFVLIVAISAITFFKSLFFYIFVLILG